MPGDQGRTVVVDHHVTVGNVARSRNPDLPRSYSLELMRSLDSPLPPARRPNVWSRLVEDQAGFKVRAAWDATRHDSVACYITMSEQVSFPLALIDRGRTRHVMLAHNLCTRFKDALQRVTGWLRWPDELVTVSAAVAEHAIDVAGLEPDRVHVLDLPVDVEFFVPDADAVEADLVVSVGREHRDYAAMWEAARRLPDCRFQVVANSPFAKRSAHREAGAPPANVEVLPWVTAGELRRLYQRAAVVVVPVEAGVRFGAGTNAVSEAQACGVPIVASEVPGLVGYLDPSSVVSAPPGDPAELAGTLGSLLSDADRRRQLGAGGRRIAVERRSIGDFCRSMGDIAAGRQVAQ